jgi:hypothetical protein
MDMCEPRDEAENRARIAAYVLAILFALSVVVTVLATI